MSRRSRYARAGQGGSSRGPRPDGARPGGGPTPRPWTPAPPAVPPVPGGDTVADEARPALHQSVIAVGDTAALEGATEPVTVAHEHNGNGADVAGNGHGPMRPTTGPVNGSGANGHPNGGSAGCTAPQLRRFIKSRTYVPMHELRRRFAINGGEDDVTLVEAGGHQIFIGLPPREGRLVEELLRGGDIGYELSLDPLTPVVVGVYPMRPVPRG